MLASMLRPIEVTRAKTVLEICIHMSRHQSVTVAFKVSYWFIIIHSVNAFAMTSKFTNDPNILLVSLPQITITRSTENVKVVLLGRHVIRMVDRINYTSTCLLDIGE